MDSESFFTKDKQFYKQLFSLLTVVAMQNLVAYSVNMADNVMLGSYSQQALSGAAVVNQIFFVVQQLTLAVGDGLVVLGSQYWGKGQPEPICRLAGAALKLAFLCGLAIVAACSLFPRQILMIFTSDEEILSQGIRYLGLIKYTFALFMLTSVLVAALRCVKTVNISFSISVVSLIINVSVNYTLIFGRFGFPEMGIRGAAVGTLIARSTELLIVLVYLWKVDRKLNLFASNFLKRSPALSRDYRKVAAPIVISNMLWAVSIPMQTAILGRISSEAIAANSVATTFYQYMKVVMVAMSSSSAVMIGNAIGSGDMRRVRSDARTLSVIDLGIGAVLACILFTTRGFLLSFYNMTDTALVLADHLIVIMSIVMLGMAYQMPVSSGIIRGGGDVEFTLYMNLISMWGIVVPLSFASAFWWKWPVEAVVLVLQSDQIFKSLPIFIRFCSYKWVKELTRQE